jgi:hypothetical protein
MLIIGKSSRRMPYCPSGLLAASDQGCKVAGAAINGLWRVCFGDPVL